MDLLKRNTGDKKSEGQTTSQPTVEPRHLTGAEFQKIVRESAVPVVVDFWAEWCGPCHAIAPAVATLASEFEGRAIVGKVNADEFPEILQGFGIMGIPTLIFFKGGVEKDRQVGVTRYDALKKKLEKLVD